MKNSEFRETLPLEILADLDIENEPDKGQKKWYCPNACMSLFIHVLKKVGVEEYRLDGKYIVIESKLSDRALSWLNYEHARIMCEE